MRRNFYAVRLFAVVVVLTLVSHIPVVGSARAESASSSFIEAAAADAVDDEIVVGGPAVTVTFDSGTHKRRLGFTAAEGQRLRLETTQPGTVKFAGYFLVLDPSGALYRSGPIEWNTVGSYDFGMGPLPVTGRYTLVFLPSPYYATFGLFGPLTMRLYEEPPPTREFVETYQGSHELKETRPPLPYGDPSGDVTDRGSDIVSINARYGSGTLRVEVTLAAEKAPSTSINVTINYLNGSFGRSATSFDGAFDPTGGYCRTGMKTLRRGLTYIFEMDWSCSSALDQGMPWVNATTSDTTFRPPRLLDSAPDTVLTRRTDGTVSLSRHYAGPIPGLDGPNRAGSIPAGQMIGGGASAFAYRPVGMQADPVNSATGAFLASEADALLPSVGVPLAIERSYDSSNLSQGSLGQGWAFGYDMRLRVVSGGARVTLVAPDGQQVGFSRDATGAYIAPPGGTATLVQTDSEYRLTTKDQTRYSFDGNGRLQAIRDRNGQGVSLAYDASGLLSSASGAERALQFAFDPATRLLKRITLPDGSSTAYDYTGDLLTAITDARGATTTYAYTAAGQLRTVTDPAGNTVVRLAYDPVSGRVSDQWDADGNHTRFMWNSDTQTSTMTDPRGGQWIDDYAGNVLASRTDPLGNTHSYEYDAQLRLVAFVDPAGTRTTLTYGAAGNITTSDVAGRVTTTTYNDRNDPVQTTNARGTTTTFGYDAAGNLTSVARPDPDGPGSLATSMAYNGRGQLVSVTDAAGRTTSYTYNTAGDVVEVTGPDGARSTFSYDAVGRVTAAVDPRGHAGANPADFTSSFAYDTAGALINATDPLGHATSFTYDNRGLRTGVTDAKGRTTSFAYDADGHLTTVTPPDPQIPATTTSYDANGNIAATTDASGRTVTYTYNLANQVTGADGALGAYSYAYDKAGRRTAVTDPTGATTALAYNKHGEVTGIDYPGVTPDVAYTYDANGNRATMTDGAGTVTYTYDALDQLASVTRGQQTFSYDYGPAGDLTRLATPAGATYGYQYDAAGRLAAATVNGDPLVNYGYNLAGLPTSVESGDGVTSTRRYDRAGRLTSIEDTRPGGAVVASFAYTLDAVGNPTAVTDQSGTTHSYTYDALNRLTRECTGDCATASESIAWTYNASGMITAVERPSGTTSYAYDIKGRLSSVTGPNLTRTYTYDDLSRVTGDGVRTYSWNAAGRLTAVTNAGDTTTYSYDGDGRRLTAQTPDRTVGYQWEPLSYQLAAETTTNGTGDLRYHLAGGGPVAINDTTGRQFLHRDALGSVRATTDTTGTVTGRYDYEPYGQLRGPPTQTPPALAFTGQYQDPTGLYHLRHRSYDPAVGQFLSPDPAAGPISAAYRYAAANPMVYVDPLGLWEAPGWVTTVNQIAGGVEVIAGTAAIACVYLCQPAVPVLAAVAATAGVVTAATSAALAVDACTTPKGACGSAIITAAIDTASAATLGGEMLRLRHAAPQAILKTPQVSSPRLQNIINDLYKGTTNPGRIGTGTTADAVRFELANPGAQVFDRSHIQKAEDYLRGLENWLKANPNAPYSERLIARSLADDLLDALGRSQ